MRAIAAGAGVPCEANAIDETVADTDGSGVFTVVCQGQAYRCEPKSSGHHCYTFTLRPTSRVLR